MRPLMPEKQSQKSRFLSVRRTSQSTRDRLRHSSHHLTSEFRSIQRRHISHWQSSSSTVDLSEPLTADSPLDYSESLARFRKRLEPSSLPMGPNFDEMLEKSLGEVEEFLPHLPETELIELLSVLADRLVELLYPPNGDARRIRIWGRRLEDLCRLLPSPKQALDTHAQAMGHVRLWFPSLASPEHSPKLALITRAQAMMGMIFPSIAYVSSIREWDDHSFHVGGTVILAAAFYQSLFRSLQLIIIESPYLSECTHYRIDKIIRILLLRTPKVSTVIQRAVQEHWLVSQKKRLGYLLLKTNREPRRTMDIIKILQANQFTFNPKQILNICYSLSHTLGIITAQKLYDSIPPSDDCQYFHTGIYLAAKVGNSKQAQALFDKLKARGVVDKLDIRNLMLSYAKGGHVREIRRVFDEYYPKNDEGQRLDVPFAHYSVAINAHAWDGDLDAVIIWLEDMQRSGLQLDDDTFTTIIQAYISGINDSQGLLDVFPKMRKLGMKHDLTTYKMLLKVFANRKDSESAESLYKMACEEGLFPDVEMTQKLLETFVRSGSFVGATRVFDYLSSQPRIRGNLSLEIYNLLIDAHVLMGAPFSVVFRLFLELKRMKLFPDRSSYFLLVSSACDAGQLLKARDIYYKMVREEEANPSVSLITAQVFKRLMSAFLRGGNRAQAKEMYDEMIKRGIQPSSNDYEETIRSYQKERTPESLRIADKFIKRLDSTYSESTSKEDRKLDKVESEGKPDLVQLYGPLIQYYGLQGNVDECERLYGKYMEAGGEPTKDMHGYVLEAYRRSKKV